MHQHGVVVSYDEVLRFTKSAADLGFEKAEVLHRAMGLESRAGVFVLELFRIPLVCFNCIQPAVIGDMFYFRSIILCVETTGEGKSAVATPDGKSRKKKKKNILWVE